jgi:hypothetical protein
MLIEAMRYEGGELILSTKDAAARQLVYNFKPGHYELKKKPKKRSLNANAFCWELCTRIGGAVGVLKEEGYRRSIREVGSYTPIPIKAEAVEEFQRIWSAHGVGWFAEVADNCKTPGYKYVFAYHGSSTYDTTQMARLIDNLIQDAQSLGIETLSEREKSLLLEEWNNGKVKED